MALRRFGFPPVVARHLVPELRYLLPRKLPFHLEAGLDDINCRRGLCNVADVRGELTLVEILKKLLGCTKRTGKLPGFSVAVCKADSAICQSRQHVLVGDLRRSLMAEDERDLLRSTFIKDSRDLLVPRYHVLALIDVAVHRLLATLRATATPLRRGQKLRNEEPAEELGSLIAQLLF